MTTPIKPSDLFDRITDSEKPIIDGLIEYLNGCLHGSEKKSFSIMYYMLTTRSATGYDAKSYQINYVLQLFREQGWQIDESKQDPNNNEPLVIFELPNLK